MHTVNQSKHLHISTCHPEVGGSRLGMQVGGIKRFRYFQGAFTLWSDLELCITHADAIEHSSVLYRFQTQDTGMWFYV